MVDRRLFVLFLAVGLFVSVLYAERARNDDLQEEEEEIDFANDDNNDEDVVVDAVKRFLLKSKKTTTTTPKSNTGSAIGALFTTTPKSRTISTSTKSSLFGFGKSTTSRYGGLTSTSKYSRTRLTTSGAKDACMGITGPCKNGGTCKTLSSGKFYCFCTQDYYGKTCENKFISTGAANNDRSRKDHCLSSPCRNNGECVGLRTTYYCRCKSPFYGINCDKSFHKREIIMDESNSSEQELDTEDLRQALAEEDME